MNFRNRRHAGEVLGEVVADLEPANPVVYGLPRGGVPVASEVAIALDCPLEALGVAKVGLPSQPELALGAIGEGGMSVRNEDLLAQVGITREEFDQLAERARPKLQAPWREGLLFLSPKGKTAIVVDDGVATGATARVAIDVLRQLGASAVWLAVPVAPRSFKCDADRLIVVERPRDFLAVGVWYDDFGQTSDDEVRSLLQRSRLP